MIKFEKIKTVADKRIALQKREKLVNTDFQKGDVLLVTEKIDGHNASFNIFGEAFSRENKIDPEKKTPLAPFTLIVDQLIENINEIVSKHLNPEHTYQFYGEFVVPNRVVKYKESFYGTWVFFDIYDETEEKYLGTRKALTMIDDMKNALPEEMKDKVTCPEVIDEHYIFTTYKELESFVYAHHDKSKVGIDGVMEGCVVSNKRTFQNKPLRAKIVNKTFKESQRDVVNTKNHTKEIRELLQYLTQQRVSKIVMNLVDDGVLQPLSNTYYTTQLELAVREVAKDITEESDLNLPYKTMQPGEKVYNKIEGMVRLTMIDVRNHQ